MSVEPTEAPPLSSIFERALLLRLLGGICVLVVAIAVLGFVFRGPLTNLASVFVAKAGLVGVFFGMLAIDAYAFPPLAHEPILFFAHAGGLEFWSISCVGGLASFLAGPLGYVIGRSLGRVSWVARMLDRTGIAVLMKHHGAWVVALAAVSPIPFSASTYAAGALRIPFWPFVLACALRIPKVAVYVAVIAFGWSMS